MQNDNFNNFLNTAKNQNEPQRILFLFAKATPLKLNVSADHQSGTIEPIMCVDKLPDEIKSFESLTKEADSISPNWDFILIGSLGGQNGVAPTSKDAAPFLDRMTNDLTSGTNITKYLIIDRNQKQIILA